jgi:large subunit ribosomal protein L7Ae
MHDEETYLSMKLTIKPFRRQPKRDLSRFVKWPRNVRIQRQRKILLQRLKIPPSINQFAKAADKNAASELFKLLIKYQPETKAAKKERLTKMAEEKAAGGSVATEKPYMIKYGLKHVTTLVEEKKAKLVCIASDVVPIELVLWMPALCRKMGVPFCIVKNKARLGQLVHKKNAAVVALTSVRKEDESKLQTLADNFTEQFNKGFSRKWGGGIMGLKTQARLEQRQKALEIELAKKAQY